MRELKYVQRMAIICN